MKDSEPWNGREPIFQAVYRNGLAELWDLALKRCDRQAAALLLRTVGAELETAERLVATTFGDRDLTVNPPAPDRSL